MDMKIKWLFIRMCWRVLTNKEQGWFFFRLNPQQQESLLTSNCINSVDVRYLGVDKRVAELIVHRLENDSENTRLLERINSQTFYDLMQTYRHSKVDNQEEVVLAFENVKEFIKQT